MIKKLWSEIDLYSSKKVAGSMPALTPEIVDILSNPSHKLHLSTKAKFKSIAIGHSKRRKLILDELDNGSVSISQEMHRFYHDVFLLYYDPKLEKFKGETYKDMDYSSGSDGFN